jgi:hypothetical protein
MAGFGVSINGWIWVSTEEQADVGLLVVNDQDFGVQNVG